MVPVSESWESIASRTGIKFWRRGRGQCPFCESRTGFSVHGEKGFHCFACGVHGDKISFIQHFHKCDFKDALRFFGLEPGKPPELDPAIEYRNKIRKGLETWTRTLSKELNKEHYIRERVITRALRRLRKAPEDSYAWNWLGWALPGLEAIAYRLDMLSGSESAQIETFKYLRRIS